MPDQQQQQSGQNLPTDVLNGMRAVGQALQQAGVPDEIMQKLGQAVSLYEEVLQEVSGGGAGPQGNQPAPRQVETIGNQAGPQG